MEWKDVILCGCSQGAFISMYLGLTNVEKSAGIISLCGFFTELDGFFINSNVPVVWMEAGKEEVLSVNRRNTYKDLINLGVDVKYFVDVESDHDNVSDQAVDSIIDKIG